MSLLEEQITSSQSRSQSMLISSSSGGFINQEAKLYHEITQHSSFKGMEMVPNGVEYKFKAHDKEATCMHFNHSGSLLATGGGDSIIKIWDINR